MAGTIGATPHSVHEGDHSQEDCPRDRVRCLQGGLEAMPDLPAKVRKSAKPHVRAFCEAIESVMRDYRPELGA
jgi:hypothetical protein